MRKSVLINLLVITIVVTTFVFVGMWYLRPGVPNEILQQAKERQLQPLMEVTPPVKKPTVQEVSQTETLARELLPRLQEQLEPVLKESISAQILKDTTLLNSLAGQLEELVLPALSETLSADQEAYQEVLRSELEGYVEKNLAELRAEASVLESDIKNSVATQLENMRAELTREVDSYVPQLVDRMIPQVVSQVVSQLEANKETYIAELQANLPSPGVSEEEAIALYDNYRSDIVMDLVPSLLDSMEEPVRKAVQDYLVEMKFIPPVPRIPTTKISIQVDEPVVVEEVAPVVAPAPQALVVKAVEQAPASMVVEEVAPVLAPAPQAPVVKAVEQVSAPLRKEGAEPILVPTFEEKETVVFMEPEVYESQRQDIRTKAIQDVLDRIAPR
ncbi:hypothetical protein [Sphaerochaeta halotolerans]|jgi:hypothetical protein|uniref:Uncharacterized protein n=1 Tax=Sphaerochaeta halotolerans TaxID=2293840 RepID=A0A372MGD8_9SPIR|nr:hypothetical protein [Sphaerochaeta halotolerans]MBG0767382.1 hypothetical protein [Spirochaetaceae bacterium]MDK2860332.1 hypothetical protein [Sphaerochaeta sp.]MXI86454.1 hypothetical protein [Sphaerochaeta halotolerans]RFU94804.1 hypothetical protein DYP60_08100 [Sphaerochaeta halotolerans]